MNHAIGIGIINISVTPCAVNDGIFYRATARGYTERGIAAACRLSV